MMVQQRKSIQMPGSNGPCRLSRRIAASIGLTIYLVVVFLASCSNSTPPPPVSVDTLSIRDLYPKALQIAKAWNEDAYLVFLETSFWPTDSPASQGASFSFRSRSMESIGLFVSYDKATGEFEDEWLSLANEARPREEIADAAWRLDSVEALEIAQEAGGAEFLAGHPDKDYLLYLRLEKRQADEDQRTVWLVRYYAGMPPSADLRIVIDALTGQVLEAE